MKCKRIIVTFILFRLISSSLNIRGTCMNNILEKNVIEGFSSNYEKRKDLAIARRTVSKNGIVNSAIDEDTVHSLKSTFSIDVDAGKITNQKQSGRCWMFAGLNVIRMVLAKKLNAKTMELSQAYLQFYDKLEKANFTLEKALELVDEPIDSRLNTFLFDNGIADGGHFAMFVNLVKKYGVIPSEIMPDNVVNSSTAELNSLLKALIGKDVLVLREMKKEGKDVEAKKEEMLQEIYNVLCVSLGVPPKSFTYEYVDKDNKFVKLEETTPLEFYEKYVDVNLDDYIVLSDAPMAGYSQEQKYASKWVNNVLGGDDVTFFNVSIEEMKKAVIKSLQANELVWFGADVSSESLRKDGLLGYNLIRFDELFGITLSQDKGERMDTRISFCNHAMTFTGVNLDENEKPNRWKVENTWGKDVGKDGFFVMDDEWFDNYVYEVFVKREFVSQDILEKIDASKTIFVDPWAVMWSEIK